MCCFITSPHVLCIRTQLKSVNINKAKKTMTNPKIIEKEQEE